MNQQSNNPFEKFVRERSKKRDSVSPEPMSAAGIDDMLEALDRVLNDEVTIENIEALEPAPILETIQTILEEISEVLQRLEGVANVESDREVATFVEQTRLKLDRLLKRFSQMPYPAAGLMEFELDFEALHDFMLSPDVSRLAS
ncbi:MAG: hypothetical protein ACI97A_002933 [Planctomycetota bacterium]|jgi:hypothetical protein